MKKVMVAFDGSNFSQGAFEFVRQLNTIAPLLVTGVFIPEVDYANLWNYSTAAGTGVAYVPIYEENETDINQTIEKFEHLCQHNDIKYRVHKDVQNFTLLELKKESRYSDVMVISGELFYKGVIESSQLEYLGNVLHNAECPVVIVPEQYDFPKSNVIAYDGSQDCVYAMKQFTYLFPEFANNKTLLVYAEDEKARDFPSKEYIEELATQHFPDLTFYRLEVSPKKYFTSWIGERKGAILISGSFNRSAFSQIFKKSFVKDIIIDHKIPVFIAHK